MAPVPTRGAASAEPIGRAATSWTRPSMSCRAGVPGASRLRGSAHLFATAEQTAVSGSENLTDAGVESRHQPCRAAMFVEGLVARPPRLRRHTMRQVALVEGESSPAPPRRQGAMTNRGAGVRIPVRIVLLKRRRFLYQRRDARAERTAVAGRSSLSRTSAALSSPCATRPACWWRIPAPTLRRRGPGAGAPGHRRESPETG